MRVLRDGESYLSLWDGSTWWIRRGAAKPQEIRRIIGDALGRPDEWDWGVFPNADNIVATVASLSGKFIAREARPEDMVLNFAKSNISTLPKFVRPGVPASMNQLSLQVEQPNPSELTYWLRAKLVEEAEEASEALLSGDLAATQLELADVLEALHSICAQAGIEWELVESARRAKRERLGGFDAGVVSRFAP
jgi:NTP pyrophosphatase (non-canonical NTP hydrolase)